MNKKKNNNVELTIKPDNDTEVKIDIRRFGLNH